MPEDRKCTATSKRSGKRCGKWAIKGKDVCRAHGGSTPIKHGLYSKYTKGVLGERIEAARNDPELLDLDRVIAIGHALLSYGIEAREEGRLEPEPRYDRDGNEIEQDSRVDPFHLEALRKLADTVGRLIVARRRNVEQAENMVPLEVVGIIIDRFVDAVNRHVQDDAARRGILDVLSKVEALPGPPVAH